MSTSTAPSLPPSSTSPPARPPIELINALKQACRQNGAQFVLLLVDKEGQSKVFGSQLFTNKLGEWFDPQVRAEAKQVVLDAQGGRNHGGAGTQSAGEWPLATETARIDPVASSSNLVTTNKPWLSGGVPAGASSGTQAYLPPPLSLAGNARAGRRGVTLNSPTPHPSMINDASRMVAATQPAPIILSFNTPQQFPPVNSPAPRLTRSASSNFGGTLSPTFDSTSTSNSNANSPYPVNSTTAHASKNPLFPSPSTFCSSNSIRTPTPPKRRPQTITPQVEEWYTEAFEIKLLLKACKEVYSLWDRVLKDWNGGQPKKQMVAGDDDEGTSVGILEPPGWWPDTVKFRVDGQIASKKERTALLIAMLLSGVPIVELERATNLRKDELGPNKMTILEEIYQIAKVEQERFINRPPSPSPPPSAAVESFPSKRRGGDAATKVFTKLPAPALEFPSIVSPPLSRSNPPTAVIPLLTSPGTRARPRPALSRRQSVNGDDPSRRATVRASPYSLSRSGSVTDVKGSGAGATGLSRSHSHSGFGASRGYRRQEGLAGIASGGRIEEEEDRDCQSHDGTRNGSTTTHFEQAQPYPFSSTSSSTLEAPILLQSHSQDALISPRRRSSHRQSSQPDIYEQPTQRHSRSLNSNANQDPTSSQRMQHSPSEGSNRPSTATRRLSPTFASPGMIKSRSRVALGAGPGSLASLEEQLSPGGRTTSSRGAHKSVGNPPNSNNPSDGRLQIQIHPAHHYVQQPPPIQQNQQNHIQFDYDYPPPSFAHHALYNPQPASAPMMFHSSAGSNDGSLSQPSSSSTNTSYSHPSHQYQPHVLQSPYNNLNVGIIDPSGGIGINGVGIGGGGEDYDEMRHREFEQQQQMMMEEQHLVASMHSMDRQQEQAYLMIQDDEVMSKLSGVHQQNTSPNLSPYYDHNSLQHQQQLAQHPSSTYQPLLALDHLTQPHRLDTHSRIVSGGSSQNEASAYMQNLSQFEFANSPASSNLLGGLGLGLGAPTGGGGGRESGAATPNGEDPFGNGGRSRNVSGERRLSAEDEDMIFGDGASGSERRKEADRKRYEGLVYG